MKPNKVVIFYFKDNTELCIYYNWLEKDNNNEEIAHRLQEYIDSNSSKVILAKNIDGKVYCFVKNQIKFITIEDYVELDCDFNEMPNFIVTPCD